MFFYGGGGGEGTPGIKPNQNKLHCFHTQQFTEIGGKFKTEKNRLLFITVKYKGYEFYTIQNWRF